MTPRKITHGDIIQLLESEGFQHAPLNGENVLFEKPSSRAALVLPWQRPATPAAPMHLAMVKRTLIDFGIMSEADFDRWVADPKRYQAA